MKRDIWVFLFVLGVILFNWPIISIFRPDISKYLFLAWFIFIALIFFVAVYLKKRDNGG
ncbi:MAG: hypothetical protein HY758_00330 [Nitrospirae bacterium]|nr:hypothetical protein [Nitrospirota bacterium]